MAVDLAALLRELQGIDWGHGLTRDGIRRRHSDFPEEVYLRLPSEKEFRSAEELVGFARLQLQRAERELEIPPSGAEEDGGPSDWGDSPIETTVKTPKTSHGVGSGVDPGYTGGGSVQTGVGREGTTYGSDEGEPS